MRFVAREVQHRAADDDVHRCAFERHRIHRLYGESLREEVGREHRRLTSNCGDGIRILVDAVDIHSGAEHEHQIASTAAARVEHTHSVADAPAQQLIEQVDVDVAELLVKRRGL